MKSANTSILVCGCLALFCTLALLKIRPLSSHNIPGKSTRDASTLAKAAKHGSEVMVGLNAFRQSIPMMYPDLKVLDAMPLPYELNNESRRQEAYSVARRMSKISIEQLVTVYEDALIRNSAQLGPNAMLTRLQTLNKILFNVPDASCGPLVFSNGLLTGTTATEHNSGSSADPTQQALDYFAKYGYRDL